MPRTLLLLAILFLAMEGAARTEDRIRYGTAWFSPYREPSEMIVRDADGVHGRRSARFQKWGMNNLGFRGPDVDSAPAPGTLRVVAAGASETFGLYESEGKEYPRQLEDSLTAALPALTCLGVHHVEVLNAAMAGMTLPTVTQDVQRRLRRFAPAVIVYYPTPSQFLNDDMPEAAPPDSTGTGPASPDWRRRLHPRVFDRLREQAKGLLPDRVQDYLRARMIESIVAAHGPGWQFTQIPPDRLAAFEAGLRGLVGATRAVGAEPVLATHGSMFTRNGPADSRALRMWGRFYPRATGAVILAFDSAAADRTRAVARDSSVALADVLGTVAPEGYADNIHFTDIGAAEAAGTIAAAVIEASKRARCGGGSSRELRATTNRAR